MRILLTGCTGFLGSALAHHWQSCGHELTLTARPSSDTRRIDGILSRVALVRIANMAELSALVADTAPDVIVHTACSYGRSGESATQILDANVGYGVALLQAVLDAPPRRVTFINTGTVLDPLVSLYALSKSQFSHWGDAIVRNRATQLTFIDIRLQQMYGPGDDSSKFTTHVLRAFRDNVARLALTPGEQRRDFIHVDDVVQAYDRILVRRDDFQTSDVIDVGSGQALRMREFVELARAVAKASTMLDFGAVPYRNSEAMLCVADVRRLVALGWAPSFDLESGLRATLQKELDQ